MDQIHLLGSTVAVVADRRTAGRDFGGVKPRRLLELLALTPGKPVSKGQLAELLWDGEPPRSWVTTLEAYVSLLRRALDPGAPVSRSLIVTTSGGYLLHHRARVDLTAFADEVRRPRRPSPASPRRSTRREASRCRTTPTPPGRSTPGRSTSGWC
jgi:DNA-binding SARP family transcriptional activator